MGTKRINRNYFWWTLAKMYNFRQIASRILRPSIKPFWHICVRNSGKAQHINCLEFRLNSDVAGDAAPFAPGEATEKPAKKFAEGPGSVIPVKTLFDVSQTFSWVATSRNNPEERVEWQRQIPSLVEGIIVICHWSTGLRCPRERRWPFSFHLTNYLFSYFNKLNTCALVNAGCRQSEMLNPSDSVAYADFRMGSF